MLVVRSLCALHLRSFVASRSILISCHGYSRHYASSSDDEKEPQKIQKATEKQSTTTHSESQDETAVGRLNRLLASMQTDDKYSLATKVNMAKPGKANKKLKEEVKRAASNKDVMEAAKRVALLLGGDNKKQTESELLSKLLGHNSQEATTTTAGEYTSLGENTSEEKTKPMQNPNDLSLSELIVSMKIDRTPKPKEHTVTRAEYVRQTLSSTSQKRHDLHGGAKSPRKLPYHEFKRTAETYTGSVNLFGSEPLGIFKDISQFKPDVDILPVWAHLQQHVLQLEVAHPPNNYYEKLISWTEQGKVWRFPIDNEQDISAEEVNEDFTDHIFLEQHLEGWCPNKGPIRHFMELVCVGLSKNPYITAKEKKDHILWYRDYFENKKDILKDVMSLRKIGQATSDEKESTATS